MPARTQCYSWQLVYSTAVHGSSLKTLYRKMAGLDSPVLLVIKDMHKKVPVFLLSLRLSFFPLLINKCHRPLTDLWSLNFQVFGAFSSDPFRVSKSCYGTGETFLFSFNPDFKVKLKLIFVTIYFICNHIRVMKRNLRTILRYLPISCFNRSTGGVGRTPTLSVVT